eukprot:1063429-Prorocentrum_minimum.AAC.1
MVCLIAPVTNNSKVQDSQKPGSVCFKRGLLPRTYPYWDREGGLRDGESEFRDGGRGWIEGRRGWIQGWRG